jgi:hypothetical protein
LFFVSISSFFIRPLGLDNASKTITVKCDLSQGYHIDDYFAKLSIFIYAGQDARRNNKSYIIRCLYSTLR